MMALKANIVDGRENGCCSEVAGLSDGMEEMATNRDVVGMEWCTVDCGMVLSSSEKRTLGQLQLILS